MRKYFLTAVTAALCIAATNASAQFKIGYVTSEAILEKYQGAKTADEKLSKDLAKIQQEVTKRESELKTLQDQLEKKSMLLSAERKKELVDSLQQKYVQYQQYVKQKQEEMISKREELFRPISDTVTGIIEKIAKEDNYDIIFDMRAGGIVYASQKYNLTERVIGIISPTTGVKTTKNNVKKQK